MSSIEVITKLLGCSMKDLLDEDVIIDNNDNDEPEWIETSLEKIKRHGDAIKITKYLSIPWKISDRILKMRVEQNLWRDSVTEAATTLEKEYSFPRGSAKPVSPKPGKFNHPDGIQPYAGIGHFGDEFFSKENGEISFKTCNSKNLNEGNVSSKPKKKVSAVPSVGDIFGDQVLISKFDKEEAAAAAEASVKLKATNKKKRKKKDDASKEQADNNIASKISKEQPDIIEIDKEQPDIIEIDKEPPDIIEIGKEQPDNSAKEISKEKIPYFPPSALKKFIDNSSNTKRVRKKKFQLPNYCLDEFLHERYKMQKQDYPSKEKGPTAPLLEKNTECIVEVTVHGKCNPDNALKYEIYPSTSSTFQYTIEILASQTLAQLRDAIHCESDYIYLKPVDHPDDLQDQANLARNKFPSSMMLIGDTIYDDTRGSKNYKYSSKIIRWARSNPHKNAGPFKAGDMSRTYLDQMTVQFGYPYLFRHMKNCEHVFVFNRIRLLHSMDEHRRPHYPRISWAPPALPKLCIIDRNHLAMWLVMGFAEFPHSPMPICETCLKSFCYDKAGRKRGEFLLYPFRQLTCELPVQSEIIRSEIKIVT